jgi:predicted ATPase/tRNA A-37 threonylcarbamoyl transferase component Bud32
MRALSGRRGASSEAVHAGAMDTDWKRIREVFERALDYAPEKRAALLDEVCAGNSPMRREVEELLRAYEKPGGFLTVPRPTVLWNVPRPDPRRVGERVGAVVAGKYRIDGVLGSGGMGAVYRATHLQLERPIALKLIRSDLIADPSMAERFRREAVAVARLRHPNIVIVHDYGTEPGVGAYLAMELLEGRSLRAELAERRRLGVDLAIDLMGQVCEGVGAAHRAGIVHRDLKPENIFLESDETVPESPALGVKVLDFGLAKLEEAFRSSGGALTAGGAVLGTPVYMSPEQCRGDEADARSDVYALGCVLYEMLTGRPPFEAGKVAVLIYKHIDEAPRRPSELVPGLAPSLEDAILRALAKAPEDRHQTVEAFARALGASPRVDTMGPGGTTIGGGRATVLAEGASDRARAADNLPNAVTRFVGRERQIGEVRGWLGKARLVTLVGPGGIGKTRLALEVASRVLGEYEDGVWFVELAALADPALVTRTVAAAIGARDKSGRPEPEALDVWLREKRLLLVLDNCEHLVDECARLAAQLLTVCPGLRVLATSREALAVDGEATWPVPALSLPEPNAATEGRGEAVRLFTDRATLARPGFEMTQATAPVIAELCRRLEGMPLAIELAAARVKALAVEQILERLDDRFRLLAGGSRTAPTRQQTLRATLDWSYGLLTEGEQALLQRLSVFSGGWTLEAAEAVCPPSSVLRPPPPAGGRSSPGDEQRVEDRGQRATDILDLLTRLVDKSLVVTHERGRETRYGILETIREYALERLQSEGEEAEARRRHADYFLALGEAAAPELDRPRQAEWFDRLETEHGNLRAALGWLLRNDAESCLRLAAAVWGLWNVHGQMTEGRRWLAAALDAAQHAPARVRMKALFKGGVLAQLQGDLETARAYFAEGMRVSEEVGDENQVAWFGLNLGFVAFAQRDIAKARVLIEEGLAASEALGDERLTMGALNALGEMERLERNWPAARRLYEQACALAKQIGEQFAISMYLCNLGAVAYAEGDLTTANSNYLEALILDHRLGYRSNIGYSLDGLAAVAVKNGESERAGRLAGAAQALRDSIGYELEPVDFAFREDYLTEACEQLGEAAFDAAFEEGRVMPLERAVEYALAGGLRP